MNNHKKIKKRFLLLLTLSVGSVLVYAEDNENAKYIANGSYLQDPYATLPSGGGNQILTESQTANHSVAQKLFQDGTWNVFTGAYAIDNGGNNHFGMYGYGMDLFGQTGKVGGFSLGGMFTAANPFFSTNMNGSHVYGNPFQPANQQVNVPEAFVEYQYDNKVQVDAGWIAINNSPWLAGNFLDNTLTPPTTYQGAEVNVYAGGGWLLSGLAFNGAQISGNNGFNKSTYYNTTPYAGKGGIIVNSTTSNGGSDGTVAAGASYSGWNNNEKLRLWAYQFGNYGTLMYADNNLNLPVNDKLNFSLGIQGGVDNAWANGQTDALTNNALGQISSNFVGAQIGVNYEWVGLTAAYNSIWGSQGSYGNGGIVSPYSYGMATDPLYTTPYMMGLVDMGTAGQAYKISPAFHFLDNNLSISPAYTIFETTDPYWNGTQEYDFNVTYDVPQVKGLALFGEYAYQQLSSTARGQDANPWQVDFMVDYTY